MEKLIEKYKISLSEAYGRINWLYFTTPKGTYLANMPDKDIFKERYALKAINLKTGVQEKMLLPRTKEVCLLTKTFADFVNEKSLVVCFNELFLVKKKTTDEVLLENEAGERRIKKSEIIFVFTK